MSTDVELEQMELTLSERLLAVILAIFVLIGALWIYAKLDEAGRPDPPALVTPTAEQQRALAVRDRTGVAADVADTDRADAERELSVRREAYRTALDAGRPSQDLERVYRAAQAAFDTADARARTADANAATAAGPGDQAARAVAAAQQQADRSYQRNLTTHGRYTFAIRLVWVLGSLALADWWLGRVRRRRPRLVPIALATIGAAAVVAFVMAGDYASDYIDFADLGPIVLSLVGIALTTVALVALQRHLARRVPAARVRKGECPFCGYPVRSGEHCEGCGREVTGSCASCAQPRRVGTRHCGFCGQE